MNNLNCPWAPFYGMVPTKLDYPDMTMYERVAETAKNYPAYTAYDFMGKRTTYKEMDAQIHAVAKSFRALGIRPGDKVTICMPNAPQTVVCFYALNLIGAISNMIHPLSSEGEIAFYLKDSQSVAAITLNQFYGKFEAVRREVPLKHLIITSIADALTPVMKVGFALTKGRKIPSIPKDADVIWWKDFLANGKSFIGNYVCPKKAADAAVVLYSGGTTGTTKGILLSNMNFNALALQTIAMSVTCKPGQSMLSVMPMFHGFGLGVCIHTMLVAGCRCILVPQFNAQSYAKLLKQKRPNYIAGVPTLYEAILRNPDMDGVDLSCLLGVFSGGDSLSIELKKKFDAFLKDHGAKIQIREGYGTTECVTASCLTPYDSYREGSIGIPFPDTYYKIVNPGTINEARCGEEGEICLTGPTLMMEYVNQPEETANALQTHADGHTWLHTGDLGTMDADGFVYYRQRMKRMIISSGYNIYPSQLENIIDAHPLVHMSCIIGVPDPYKMQKVKAFVVLKPGAPATEETKESILEHCKKNIAKYAMPYDIEFRADFPKTLVGKVAYRQLEEEELAKSKA